MERFIKFQEMTNKNHEASIRNLERKIGQISRKSAKRPANIFSSDTISNLKEECKAIQLRSDKTVEKKPKDINKDETEMKENDKVDHKRNNESQTLRKDKKIIEPQLQEKKGEVKPYVPKLPYPQRLHKEMRDQQFPKFLKIFQKLEINIPLVETLEQMPLYAKFLKELITKKRS
ncbi:uncharacterized protein DS421_5g165630 [Arachis hypogaea]|nr:uncharacterized protein DS421_5g165630 [Arachis hypogaea]